MSSSTENPSTEAKTIAEATFSPVVIPGELFFGLYNDNGLKVEGGFQISEFILSKHMPLVSQSFADKAVVINDFKLDFEHALGGEDTNNGFHLELTLVLDGATISKLNIPLSGKSPPPQETKDAKQSTTPGNTGQVANPTSGKTPTTVSTSSIFWINIQKSIGPIHIEKIGFNLIGDDIQVLLNGGLSTSTFGVDLIGLSATVPIFGLDSIDDIKMDLQGLAIAFETSALTIEGGLLRNNVDGNEEYDGALMIKTADFSVTALGAFTSLASQGHINNSFFGFAFLDTEIGGPPSFFVTGISAGFGYNRVVKAPDVSEVGSFPLVAGLNNPSKLGLSGSGLPSLDDLGNVFQKMNTYIEPKLGEYWFAAGVQFVSYELIHSNIVAIVEVGKEFEILVLGKSFASFPPAGTTYGYVELDLEIVVQPDEGIFKAEAVLSNNSYVLDKNCHLTGGFAFYCWFGDNPHAGDFVFTVGGYHPAFKPPDYYPHVSRLGFNWQVSGDVTIKGGAYFALTPSCIMAGGSLEALYHSGNLKAWFTAYADFLIYWKPFYFTADIGVDVGVSYHVHFLFVSKTLSFDLGASVELHGPPTGGKVHIHLWIISFTVSFGASESAGNKILGWTEFKKMVAQSRHESGHQTNMRALAATGSSESDLCHLIVSNGLLKQVKDSSGKQIWLVRADEFQFTASSAVPMTKISLNGTSVNSTGGGLAIRPMHVSSISSSVGTITVTSKDGNPMHWSPPNTLTRAMPQALWGKPIEKPSQIDPNEALINDCLVGLQAVSPQSTFTPHHTGQINVAKAFTYILLYPDGSTILPYLPISAGAPAVANHAKEEANSRSAVINPAIAKTASVRSEIVSSLTTMIDFPTIDEAMNNFNAVSNFATDPLVGQLAVT
ncbi:MAG: DUF6603 domain-containing protein [Bacteroidota bacterium]